MRSKNTATKRNPTDQPMDAVGLFEEFVNHADAIQFYQLRLYITGTTPRSSRAISNIRSLCEEYLAGHYNLEVVDIYQQPGEAAKEQIIAAPTLIKELPPPPKRLIGDLSDRGKVILHLNLKGK